MKKVTIERACKIQELQGLSFYGLLRGISERASVARFNLLLLIRASNYHHLPRSLLLPLLSISSRHSVITAWSPGKTLLSVQLSRTMSFSRRLIDSAENCIGVDSFYVQLYKTPKFRRSSKPDNSMLSLKSIIKYWMGFNHFFNSRTR